MKSSHSENSVDLPKMAEINDILAPYQKSDVRHSILQIADTLIPYIILWVLMAFSLHISYLLTLALAVVASGFMVRLFIFFHDCGHNSFFPTVKANRAVGFWLGVLTLTPGEQWWHSHAIHHATSGNLDKRGIGDVTTLTVDEYYEKRWFGKWGYRFFRNPLIMFVLGPFFSFLVMNRLPLPHYGRRETRSVILTDLAIAAMVLLISLAIGFKGFLMIQIPITMIGGSFGIWLFYVQHQFEDPYWERSENWNYVASALLGASYLRMPGILNWFTGNIGFHHIHHLSPRIPNYNLAKAHQNSPVIKKWTRSFSLGEGLHFTRLKLWDEMIKKMVGFGRPSRLRKGSQASYGSPRNPSAWRTKNSAVIDNQKP